MNQEQLLKELKKEVAKANRRIKTLNESKVNSHAKSIAKNDIRNYLGRKVKSNSDIKFIANKKMSFNELQKEARAVRKFNESKSSQISEIKKFTNQRKKTLEKKYGIKLKKKDEKYLYNFFNSKAFQKMKQLNVPSSVVVSKLKNFNGDWSKLNSDLESLENKRKGETWLSEFSEYINNQK